MPETLKECGTFFSARKIAADAKAEQIRLFGKKMSQAH
jgi:hypothetical protein